MIYTFYSFKGGVGRSMTLAGAAYLFAERGLRVLAIDFDLEAPGLERYYFDRTAAREAREHPGVIDLILTYKRALTTPAEFEKASFKQWRDFCINAVPSTAAGGSVHLMTAGCREPQEKLRTYARAVRNFDWQDFFENWSGADFFTWLRRQLTDPQNGYDVVLVDSRTGVTEMGGVCAYQLADVAVMLCAANYQNLDGTLAVLRDFRSDAVLALRSGRPLELLVLPARLEQNHPRRAEFMEEFTRTFASEGLPKVLADARLNYASLAIPYDPSYAVTERLVGEKNEIDLPNMATTEALGLVKLCDALTLLAREGRLVSHQGEALSRLTGQSVDSIVLPLADVTKGNAGSDAFFAYALSDIDVARQLVRGLRSAGISVYDPADIGVGDDFAELLETAFAYSEWLVVLLGEESSPAFETLLRKARERGKPRVLPVLLADAAHRVAASFGLEHSTSIVFRDAGPSAVAAALPNLIATLKTRQHQAAPDVTRADPYPGMRPFAEDDAPMFFGRDADAQALCDGLAAHDIVLITGASGVGKTSTLRAGLLPKLRVGTGDGSWDVESVDLAAGESIRSPLSDSNPRKVLILDGVDTFLEGGDDAARRERMTQITASVVVESATRKVLICGRGTWGDGYEWALLEQLKPRAPRLFRYEIRPLPATSVREVIERPALKHRHLLEGGLIDRLMTDAGGGAAALSLLQLVLPDLWKQRRRGWLTNHAYDQIGTVNGAVRRRRDAFYATLSPVDRRRATIFMSNLVSLDSRLVLVADHCEWRRLRTIPALGPDVSALRDRLVDQRLVVATVRADDLYCALAASNASACLDSEDIDAEFMLWRQRFSTFVKGWRSARSMIQEPALGEAQRWLGSRRDELSEDERSLIETSGENSAKLQLEAQQRHALEQARELLKDEQARNIDYRDPKSGESNALLRERGSQVLARIKSTGDAESLADAKEVAGALMGARDYEFATLVLETTCRLDPQDLTARRRYAHCFIGTGRVVAAIDMLSSLIRQLSSDHPERLEALGLLGRAHRQIFLDAADSAGTVAKHALGAAIDAYGEAYRRNPELAWFGVNLIALLNRADRLGVRAAHGLATREVATSVITTLSEIPENQRDSWYLAMLTEAHLGHGDWDAAERCLREYIASPSTTSFEITSTLGQLTRVWDLETTGSRGAGLVAALRAALLRFEGARVNLAAKDLGRLQTDDDPRSAQLEAILGGSGRQTFQWWKVGLDRLRAVASVRQRLGDRVGTGFLASARDLGFAHDELVLVTAWHIVNETGASSALRPEDAEIIFEAADAASTYGVRVLWQSPSDLLDVSILQLSPAVSGIQPLPLAKALPAVDERSHVYIASHAGGRDLNISISDAGLIDHEGPPAGKPQIPGVCRVHYNVQTGAGSSGGPVLNGARWEVIAIHQRSGKLGIRKLNGVPGTYAAKEGIWIQSAIEAIRTSQRRM